MIRELLQWTGEQLGAVAPTELLREHLRADAPVRERVATRALGVICAACIPVVLLLSPLEGWRFGVSLALVLALVVIFCFTLLELLARGRYHPAIPWLNSAVLVSLPLPFMVVETALKGGTHALTSSVSTVWTGLVVATVIRLRPTICLLAGVLAAVELLVLYAVVRAGWPLPLETLTVPWMLLRALYLLLAGFGGAVIARSFVRRAEAALHGVREQDLMGRYFIHEKLGVGGMAEVYRATYSPEGGFQKTVAIKRVLPTFAQRPHFKELFLDEARLCALLNHPNVVQVFDCGRYQDSFILAMEYVDGMSLQALLNARSEPLPLSAASYLGAELGAALQYLHNRIGLDGEPLGLVHRDVNPPNILISRFGEVKLADFGVAHAATLTSPQDQKQFVGKNLYAAPEQRRLEVLDRRSDLFALGLTLYEALTTRTIAWERLPGEGKADFTGLIPPPSHRRQEVPPGLDAAVMKLLEFDPERRFQSGEALREALTELSGSAAPYPGGQAALAQAVTRGLQLRFKDTEVTAPEAIHASFFEDGPPTRSKSGTS